MGKILCVIAVIFCFFIANMSLVSVTQDSAQVVIGATSIPDFAVIKLDDNGVEKNINTVFFLQLIAMLVLAGIVGFISNDVYWSGIVAGIGCILVIRNYFYLNEWSMCAIAVISFFIGMMAKLLTDSLLAKRFSDNGVIGSELRQDK